MTLCCGRCVLLQRLIQPGTKLVVVNSTHTDPDDCVCCCLLQLLTCFLLPFCCLLQRLTCLLLPFGCLLQRLIQPGTGTAAASSYLTNANAIETRALLMLLLQRLIQPGTKLVVVNFPHNPTGATLSPEAYQALIARCREVGAWLFSDEMYKFTGVYGGIVNHIH
jgi:hypothetical protein